MLSCGGSLILFFGLFLLWLSRDGDGPGRLFFQFLALALCLMGVYLAFFETGNGLARFLPFLKP